MLDICLLYKKHLCMLYLAVLATKEQHLPSAQTWNLSPVVSFSSLSNSCVGLYFKCSFNPKGFNLQNRVRPGGDGVAFGTTEDFLALVTASLAFGTMTGSGALPSRRRYTFASIVNGLRIKSWSARLEKIQDATLVRYNQESVFVGERGAKRC